MLVLVVAKKVRTGLAIFSDDEFLPGCAIAGAKALSFNFASFGPTKVVPCYKARPKRKRECGSTAVRLIGRAGIRRCLVGRGGGSRFRRRAAIRLRRGPGAWLEWHL